MVDLETPPTIVLRFENGKLLDVSSEFQAYFDHEIARLGKDLDPAALRNFKSSDGKLPLNSPLPAERLHQLRQVKAKVLEIVWCYLTAVANSGHGALWRKCGPPKTLTGFAQPW